MKDENEPPFDLRERTTLFALRVIRMFVALPKTEEAMVMGKQALRSGTSVGANFREAHRSRSKAEFIAKVGDCLKELDEPSGARQTMRSIARRVSAEALIKPPTGSNSSPAAAPSPSPNSPPSRMKPSNFSPSSLPFQRTPSETATRMKVE